MDPMKKAIILSALEGIANQAIIDYQEALVDDEWINQDEKIKTLLEKAKTDPAAVGELDDAYLEREGDITHRCSHVAFTLGVRVGRLIVLLVNMEDAAELFGSAI